MNRGPLVLGLLGVVASTVALALALSSSSIAITVTSTSSTTVRAVHHRAPGTGRRERAERLAAARDRWMIAVAHRVSVCEEGGDWHYSGSTYSGGLGFLWATWDQFKRPSDPANMADATPLEQARALFALVEHYGIAMPDQSGCTGGY